MLKSFKCHNLLMPSFSQRLPNKFTPQILGLSPHVIFKNLQLSNLPHFFKKLSPTFSPTKN